MAFNLRVTFAGLCLHVRRQKEGELKVVLVDASSPSASQHDAGMHTHKPFLAVGTAHLAQGNQCHPDKVVPDLRGDLTAVFDLPPEEVLIHTDSPLRFEQDIPPKQLPRATFEATTLAWLAPFEVFGFGISDLHPACLEGSPHGPVAARVSITGGRVFSSSLEKQDGSFALWELSKSGGKKVLQALANLISVDLIVPSKGEYQDEGQIILGKRRLTLVPPAQDQERVDIVIGNLPLDPHHFRTEDLFHFRWFYELLKEPLAPESRPIPLLAQLQNTSASTKCPELGVGFLT